MKMPNNVTNKLIFESRDYSAISAICIPNGKYFDFDALIPMPPSVYRGELSSQEMKDFPLNWDSWCRENWGTKWNAYDFTSGICRDGRAYIQFDTAWSIPYPIIVAFANIFKIEFEHRYFDEGHSFWGIEQWGIDNLRMVRLISRKNDPDDFRGLSIDLKNIDQDSN
jgi:Ferredoxin-like domain in Api92-like protein